MTDVIYATVRHRRGEGWNVRPTAEQVDGKRHKFMRGWEIGEDDSSIYVGETAWIPDRDGWPDDAPRWLAEGDLTSITEQT